MTTGQPLLRIDETLFSALIRELGRRGKGTRESGAFLLTLRTSGTDSATATVTAIAYYDDLDPDSLNGAIAFGADGYAALSKLCRGTGMRVIADIHTHPGTSVRQSWIDASHPMVAIAGHIGIIAPRFATNSIIPAELGVHVFNGNGQWTSHYGGGVASILQISKAGALRRAAAWIRNHIARLRSRRAKQARSS